MTQKVMPVPAGYHTVTPYLVVKDAESAIEFYKKAFNAKEIFRLAGPNGKICNAQIKIGDSHLMLADEYPEMGALGPLSIGGSPVTILLYLEDVDKVFSQAINQGAMVLREVKDQFYGDRSGSLRDPFGHIWCISTHIEDVSAEEMSDRMGKMSEQKAVCS